MVLDFQETQVSYFINFAIISSGVSNIDLSFWDCDRLVLSGGDGSAGSDGDGDGGVVSINDKAFVLFTSRLFRTKVTFEGATRVGK